MIPRKRQIRRETALLKRQKATDPDFIIRRHPFVITNHSNKLYGHTNLKYSIAYSACFFYEKIRQKTYDFITFL